MKTSLITSLAASLVLGLLTAPAAQAAVIVTMPTGTGDNDPDTGGQIYANGSMVVTHDISFTITTAGTLRLFVFDEWVTSDGTSTDASVQYSPNALSYSINGGPTATTVISGLTDNHASPSGDLTPNDGFLIFNGVVVAVNDVFTLKAATYTLSRPPSNDLIPFNSQANQTFTGSAFLASSSRVRLSANTSVVAGAVPEPSRALLLLGGLSALMLRRRRR